MRRRTVGLGLVGAALVIYSTGGSAQQMPAPFEREAPIVPGAAEHSPPPKRDPDDGARKPAGEGQQLPSPPSVITAGDDAKSADDKERRAEEREQQDLQAQRSMAESARKMLAPAWWQVGIASAGAFLLVMSLVYSAKATKAAAEAATAAQEVLKAERAWLTYDAVDWENYTDFYLDGTFHKRGLGFSIRWRNSGRSPALHAIFWCDFRLAPPNSEPPKFKRPQLAADEYATVMGPGTTGSSAARVLVDDQVTELIDGSINVFVYAHVEYNDIFNPEKLRISEACVAAVYTGKVQLPDGQRVDRFGFKPVGGQNTAT